MQIQGFSVHLVKLVVSLYSNALLEKTPCLIEGQWWCQWETCHTHCKYEIITLSNETQTLKLHVYRFRVNDYASFLAAKIASAGRGSYIFVYRIGTIHCPKTNDLIWNVEVYIKILSCAYLYLYVSGMTWIVTLCFFSVPVIWAVESSIHVSYLPL